MHLLITILVFILILSVLVLIHELGHYYFARRSGVRVDEFGFGLPPRIWGKKVGETIYSINLFPFGGFVRLFGENPQETGAVSDPRSFNAKTLRERFSIVIAGVAMNLILAILLLTFGFWFGIKPLLIEPKDIFQAIESGDLQVRSGFTVKHVDENSPAAKIGIAPDDILIGVNGGSILEPKFLVSALKDAGVSGKKFRLRRGDSILELTVPKDAFTEKDTTVGIELYEHFILPRVGIQSVKADSEVARSGLKAGDLLLRVNGQPIYSLQDFQATFLTQKILDVTYERDYKEHTTQVSFPQRKSIVISEVLAGSAAEKADFKKGDVVVQVQRTPVNMPDEVITLLQQAKASGQPAQFLIDRQGTFVTLYVSAAADGTFGVQVSPMVNQNIDIVTAGLSIPTSIVDLKPVSYGLFQSIGMSLKETYRMGKATFAMVGVLFTDIFSRFNVPEGVAGPVGIAQMTGIFVDEGFFSVIRFMAMLSLSLAILNLLPFPGLDGGRLLFIVIEAVMGRRVDQKVEQAIHAIGAILLIVIILAVTYKDIVRIAT